MQRLAMITNYRSTASIVQHSSALIAVNYRNPSRGTCVPKALRAAPGTQDNRAVQFVRYRSKESQTEHILSCVNWWHEHGGNSVPTSFCSNTSVAQACQQLLTLLYCIQDGLFPCSWRMCGGPRCLLACVLCTRLHKMHGLMPVDKLFLHLCLHATFPLCSA